MQLIRVPKTDPFLLESMEIHYSKPKGFVGRSICYGIIHGGKYYGSIVGGSATLHLPGRNEFFGENFNINDIVNNIFFHVEKVDGKYPFYNFTSMVISKWRYKIKEDWFRKYGITVKGFETLVELPRKGECYLKDAWTEVGTTKGFTCKRIAGKGTDSWSGKRVWDTENLKPKLVFCRNL